jgi:hypothetical protein
LPYYVYCTVLQPAYESSAPFSPVVFTQGEFESRSQAGAMIQRTQQLLTSFGPSPEVVEPTWEIVEAESLEAAKALVAILGRPLSPN